MIQSLPIAPRIPDLPFYSPGSLWLFSRFDRDSYLKTFGVQPPAFDPSRPVKRWLDTSTANTVSYQVFGYKPSADGTTATPQYKTLTLSKAEASTVNLPGLRTYPAYLITSTPTQIKNNFGPDAAMNPIQLSTKEQAEQIADALDPILLNWITDETDSARHIMNGETRRLFAIQIGNDKHNVGQLLFMQNRNGVGAPGKWTIESGQPTWTPIKEESGEQVTGEVPVPARALLPNERIKPTLTGTVIYRTDRESPYNPAPVVGDTVLLKQMDAKLDAVLDLLRK